ncbi:hypothetical protein V8C35DRAFT_327868 [Trichoderma chlorosporum]
MPLCNTCTFLFHTQIFDFRIAATSSPARVTERAWLSSDRRCVTNVWAGHRRMWPMFNKEYLHALKITHEDLSDLLPDIEAVERLVHSKGPDDNGRGGGSIIAILRELPASDETYANISDWIHRSKSPWYPTRLLDVGFKGSPSITLVHSAQAIDKVEKYMTLSHRWGDASIPTLTTKTIITWTQGFSVKILPKTFQDFITLAQRLQIRYVWIDSLYLRMVDKPNIDWRVKREPNPEEIATEKCLLVENEFWEDQISKSPLSIRGWVVQERWLCPRNLRFGPREVFFECGQSTLSESNLQMLQSPQVTLLPVTPGTELYTAWGEILCKYSRCFLTYATDRTVAFSGIAKFFRSLVDDKYVAGLWLRNLASEMMWYRNRLLTTAVIEGAEDRLFLFKKDEAGAYRAPSFSWASTAVPIEPNHMNDNILIIGTLKKMRLQPYYDGEMTDLYVVPDSPGGNSKKMKDWSEAMSNEATEATLDFQLNNDDIDAWVSKDNLYYIPWQDCWNSHSASSSKRDDNSLTCLLVELADINMNRFRRIGRIYIHSKSQRKLYITKQDHEPTLPCQYYDKTTGRHTIYLI